MRKLTRFFLLSTAAAAVLLLAGCAQTSSSTEVELLGKGGSPVSVSSETDLSVKSPISVTRKQVPDERLQDYILSVTGPASIQINEPFTCTITLTAKQNYEDATVQQRIPAGFEYVNSRPQASRKGEYVIWKLPAMRNGESRTMQATYVARQKRVFEVCARAQVVLYECFKTSVTQPRIAIRKTGPESAVLGETIPYTIVVKNTGDGIARDVVLRDTVPRGLQHSSGRASLVNRIGTLQPGEERTVKISLKAVERGNHCNKAVVTTANAGTAEDEACTRIVKRDMRITKRGPVREFFNKKARYTIMIENTADAPLTDVTVRDTLPPYTVLLAAPNGQASGNTVTWQIPRLNPGQKQSFSLTLTSATAGIHTNVVVASSREGLRRRAMAPTLWKGSAALLIEVVDTVDPLVGNEEGHYIIEVMNQGTEYDRNVQITAEFPSQISPVAVRGVTRGTVQGNLVTFEPYPSLAPKQKIKFEIKARAVSPGDARLKVRMNSNLLRTPVTEEESTHVY
jgi:uncharacterized repeat protein (TIGR01451 family)